MSDDKVCINLKHGKDGGPLQSVMIQIQTHEKTPTFIHSQFIFVLSIFLILSEGRLKNVILQHGQCQSKLIVFNSDQLPIRLPLDELPMAGKAAYIWQGELHPCPCSIICRERARLSFKACHVLSFPTLLFFFH